MWRGDLVVFTHSLFLLMRNQKKAREFVVIMCLALHSASTISLLLNTKNIVLRVIFIVTLQFFIVSTIFYHNLVKLVPTTPCDYVKCSFCIVTILHVSFFLLYHSYNTNKNIVWLWLSFSDSKSHSFFCKF